MFHDLGTSHMGRAHARFSRATECAHCAAELGRQLSTVLAIYLVAQPIISKPGAGVPEATGKPWTHRSSLGSHLDAGALFAGDCSKHTSDEQNPDCKSCQQRADVIAGAKLHS